MARRSVRQRDPIRHGSGGRIASCLSRLIQTRGSGPCQRMGERFQMLPLTGHRKSKVVGRVPHLGCADVVCVSPARPKSALTEPLGCVFCRRCRAARAAAGPVAERESHRMMVVTLPWPTGTVNLDRIEGMQPVTWRWCTFAGSVTRVGRCPSASTLVRRWRCW